MTDPSAPLIPLMSSSHSLEWGMGKEKEEEEKERTHHKIMGMLLACR